jgi:uncharacterized membrane protein
MNDEAGCVSDSSGEEIVIPLDLAAGASQEYVEFFCGDFRRTERRTGRKSDLSMSRTKTASKCLLAIFMVGAGAMHFVRPDFYVKIMPPYLPIHRELVFLSGICEVALGVSLLIPRYSRLAAWGIIGLLIAVCPANIYVYQNQELVPGSPILRLLRLPLQGVLLLWAYWHTRPTL